MRPLLKFLHQLGAMGFVGALATQLAVGMATLSAGAGSAVREAMALATAWVVGPALLLAIVSGLLLMAAHAPFMAARWVWLKALLGAVVGALLVLGPAALGTDGPMGAVMLGLSVLAVALGVWRPRLAQPSD